MRSSVSVRTWVTLLLSAALTVASMLLYPGGTALDRSTRGYSLSRNFLSDLGMTVAYDGRPNVAGAICFIGALCILVLGLGGTLVSFVRRYAVTPAARGLALAAGGVGLLAAVAFLGVAFTPEDRVMHLHLRFTLWAFELLPAAALLLALAARQSRVAAQRVVLTWTLLGALLAGYAGLLAWGPTINTPVTLTTYVLAQKVVTVALLLTVAAQSAMTQSAPRYAGRRTGSALSNG